MPVPAALHDPLLAILSILAVSGLVLGARAAGERGVGPVTLRRFVHAAVGLWTVFLTPRFHHLDWALVPPLAFLALNASGQLERLAPTLARRGEPGGARGLWTFPLGVALAYLFFWSDPGRAPILAGCAVLALADPAAAWIGTRFGQRRFHPLGSGRTLEGSLGFFLVAAATTAAVALAATPRPLLGVTLVRLAIGCAAAGAVVEALSPRGWDNATIPLAVGAAFRALA